MVDPQSIEELEALLPRSVRIEVSACHGVWRVVLSERVGGRPLQWAVGPTAWREVVSSGGCDLRRVVADVSRLWLRREAARREVR